MEKPALSCCRQVEASLLCCCSLWSTAFPIRSFSSTQLQNWSLTVCLGDSHLVTVLLLHSSHAYDILEMEVSMCQQMWPGHEKHARDRNKLAEKHSCNAIKGAHSSPPPCNVYLAALEPILSNLFGDTKKGYQPFFRMTMWEEHCSSQFSFSIQALILNQNECCSGRVCQASRAWPVLRK